MCPATSRTSAIVAATHWTKLARVDAPENGGRRPLVDRIRERKEQHRERSRAFRIAFAAAGGTLVALGLVLSLPFIPGPGLLLVAIGLAMLALEFDRAERLLELVLVRLERIAERAARAGRLQKAVGGVVVALAALGFVTAVVLWDVPLLPG